MKSPRKQLFYLSIFAIASAASGYFYFRSDKTDIQENLKVTATRTDNELKDPVAKMNEVKAQSLATTPIDGSTKVFRAPTSTENASNDHSLTNEGGDDKKTDRPETRSPTEILAQDLARKNESTPPEKSAPLLKATDADKAPEFNRPQPKEMKSVSSEDSFRESSLVSFAPRFSFDRIDATENKNGAHSTLASGLNFGFDLGWQQIWNEKFLTKFEVFGLEESFSSRSSLLLDHSSQFYGGLELSAAGGASRNFQAFFRTGAEQSPFIRGESPTANTIDAALIGYAGVGFVIPLYNSPKFYLSFSPAADYRSSSEVSASGIKSGYDIEGKIKLHEDNGTNSHRYLEADLYYRYQNQNTDLTNQTSQTLGAQLTFGFDFF